MCVIVRRRLLSSRVFFNVHLCYERAWVLISFPVAQKLESNHENVKYFENRPKIMAVVFKHFVSYGW